MVGQERWAWKIQCPSLTHYLKVDLEGKVILWSGMCVLTRGRVSGGGVGVLSEELGVCARLAALVTLCG